MQSDQSLDFSDFQAYHLILTQKCNLSCTYCGSECNSSVMPDDIDLEETALQKYFGKLKEKPVIAFYGGEPILQYKKIQSIMDMIEAKAFVIQTNGTLLHRLDEKYLSRFHSILVSVDGPKHVTDRYRGRNTFDRAINGAKYAITHGFNGELIARMTVTKDSDIYSNVKYLLEVEQEIFTHVHWQLDALWDIPDNLNNFLDEYETWILQDYNVGITKLVDFWIDTMKAEGRILSIVPFLGITYSLLMDEPTELRCGAANDFFSITTDGRITVCPIPPSVNFAVVGDIFNSNPSEIVGVITLDDPCDQCDELSVCGGRCIYTNKTKNWGDRGFAIICETTKHLINEIRRVLPNIQQLITLQIIEAEQFRYPKIPNGVEIIP